MSSRTTAAILVLILVGTVPVALADGSTQPAPSHAFLPGWSAYQYGTFSPSSGGMVGSEPFSAHSYDDEGNMYFLATGQSGSWFNGQFTPPSKGFHLLKLDVNGTLQSSITIQCNNYCNQADYAYSKVIGVHSIGVDQVYVVVGVYSDVLQFGSQQQSLSSWNLVTAFYDNGSWSWVDTRPAYYASYYTPFHGVDESGNLYVVHRPQYSGTWQPYTVLSGSPSGMNWVRTLEIPYASPTYNYLTPLFSTGVNGLSTFVTAPNFKYDSQSVSCPPGGESGYCHTWMEIESTGLKNVVAQTPYTSTHMYQMQTFGDQLYLIGYTDDYVAGSDSESNFTGQKISHSPRFANYFAVLNASGTWDYAKAVNQGSSQYRYTMLANVLDNGDAVLHDLMVGTQSIDGVTVTRHSSVDGEAVVLRISPTEGVQWSNSVGFSNPSSYPTMMKADNETIAFQITHPSNGYAIYNRNGTSVSESSGSSNYDIIWMELESGEIVDVESTSATAVVSRSPEGGVLATANSYVFYYMPDLDGDNVGSGDNCPDIYNPNQFDYNQDGFGDACDADDDSDGIEDPLDDCPQGEKAWTSTDLTDHDGDGCRDDSGEDLDDDNDGHADTIDGCQYGITGAGNDLDGDGCKDAEDNDDDGDNVRDESDVCANGNIDWSSGTLTDHDGDGCEDGSNEDADDDNDGIADSVDACPLGATNWPSNLNTDFDGDGCKDGYEDEDDDGDGIVNSIDDCPRSVGSVNANGCSATQALENEDGGSNVVYYVCASGTLVVLDPSDCPASEPVNGTNSTTEPSNEFYYVCPGGSDVVTNLADCPNANIDSNNGDVTLVVDPSSNNTEGYVVCPAGDAIVLDLAKCPSEQAQSNTDTGSNDISSSADSLDSILVVFMGGTFLMSAIAVAVVVLRKPQSSSSNFASLEAADYLFKEEPVLPKSPTVPPLVGGPPRSSTPSAPSADLIGTAHGGQEWLEWPEGSDQHWYRAPGFGGAWTKYDG
jgi:hypothetical protein